LDSYTEIWIKKFVWSDDSRYLATKEWLATDEQKGPLTRVALIDTKGHKYPQGI